MHVEQVGTAGEARHLDSGGGIGTIKLLLLALPPRNDRHRHEVLVDAAVPPEDLQHELPCLLLRRMRRVPLRHKYQDQQRHPETRGLRAG